MEKIKIQGLSDLTRAANELLAKVGNNKVFAFYGEMGAGKTTFIKALCDVMKVENNVNSPTFSLVNEYYSEIYGNVYHFDFYRIDTLEEAFDFGYEEYFYSKNYCFIEWPEKIISLLPKDIISIKINILGQFERELEIN
jgi:tRNA threonylcarbamoyladenosine biosynthesis protein TsaE